MPTPLTAVGFGSFPFELAGMADSFMRLRPEHVLQGYGPVLTKFEAPMVATPEEAEREGTWEPRYGLTWWPVGRVELTKADLTTPWRERQRLLDKLGPREVEVTPEFVKKLLG